MSVGKDYYMRDAKIYFVTHPMKEPPYRSDLPGTRICIPWNTTTAHRRKCIKRHGCYLKDGKRTESDLYFWGEYEAPSDCIITGWSRPKAIHDVLHPVRGTTPVLTNAQNTDPYVFGEHFKNICCGITNRKYQRGDIIIFGCTDDRSFWFDTVLVIDGPVPINYLRNHTQYFKASIEPLNEAYKHAGILDKDGNIKKKDFFFKGQSHLENNNLFSFVPCKLEASSALDELPCLDLKKFGTTNHCAITYSDKRWEMIREAVEDKDWCFGVYIEKV